MSPNKPRQKQTLRGRFLRITIPLIFISVICVFAVIEVMAHHNAVTRLEQALESMIRTQAAALANPVWNLDDEQIELSLKAVTTNREILSARVLDQTGKIMSKAGDEPLSASPGNLMPLSREIVYDAGDGERTIGTLEFVATRQFVWQPGWQAPPAHPGPRRPRTDRYRPALYALRTIIGKPLVRLLGSINQARSGEERRPVEWTTNDELGEVIAAYNEMQAQQAEYEATLRASRDNLEDRVRERTAELAAKTTQLEQLSRKLSKYLSPQLYQVLFEGRQDAQIAASRKKLTVFFSDIADFTETADRLESEELTELLNHYLTEMTKIALEHGGTVDKYVGDAIVIFFGDPETRGAKRDAIACVRMAQAMQARMQELQNVWRNIGISRPLRCRIGIHTDFCTVGNFGSEDRLDYTIIGRGVNIAARLESMASPGEILISFETYAHVHDEIECTEKGELEVRGLAYPVATFQVQCASSEARRSAVLDEGRWKALIPENLDQLSIDERRMMIERLSDMIERLKLPKKEDVAE